MAGEIVVAYYDGGQPDVGKVMPGGYKYIEDFTGGDRNIIVAHSMNADSSTKLYKLSSKDIPAARPAGSIPTHLLNDEHQIDVLGPGGIYEQPITRLHSRAARLIIIHHTS